LTFSEGEGEEEEGPLGGEGSTKSEESFYLRCSSLDGDSEEW